MINLKYSVWNSNFMILKQISFDILVMIVIILQGYMAKPNISYLFSLTLQSLLLHLVCRHLFLIIRHQYEQLKSLKDDLSSNECLVHVDFSENYAYKL